MKKRQIDNDSQQITFIACITDVDWIAVATLQHWKHLGHIRQRKKLNDILFDFADYLKVSGRINYASKSRAGHALQKFLLTG